MLISPYITLIVEFKNSRAQEKNQKMFTPVENQNLLLCELC